MTLLEFFNDVYCPLRLINKSPKTRRLYRYSIRLFGITLGREPSLDDLDDLIVARHLERLIADGRAPGGVNKERDQLVAIWNLAAKKKLVAEFPSVRRVHQPYRIPWAWTQEEMWRLRISCNMQRGTYAGIPAKTWWTALHVLLFATGERITAMLSVTWSDLSGNVLVFPAEIRKGAKRPGVCTLPAEAMQWLQEIQSPSRELIFPWPYSQSQLYKSYKQILARAELDTSSRSKFHRMRRSHATHLKVAGGDPTISLGHANPTTTTAYLDPRQIPDRVSELMPTMGGI